MIKMRIVNILGFFLLASSLGKCQTVSQPVDSNVKDTLVDNIVLINGGILDRCQIRSLLNSLSRCNPKVIGINFIFHNDNESPCDSVLEQSMKILDKVVLVE